MREFSFELGNPSFYAPGRSWSTGTNSGQGIISALGSAESNEAVTSKINSVFGADFIEDNCYTKDGYCQAGKALDGAAHTSYTGGAAYLGGYSLSERLISWGRSAPERSEAIEYSLPAPGSGELPNLAFITPSNAHQYAAEIAQISRIRTPTSFEHVRPPRPSFDLTDQNERRDHRCRRSPRGGARVRSSGHGRRGTCSSRRTGWAGLR